MVSDVQRNTDDNNDVYIPQCLMKHGPFIAAIDNIDANMDTHDGKDANVGDQSEAIVQGTYTSNRYAHSDNDVLKQNIPVWAAYN